MIWPPSAVSRSTNFASAVTSARIALVSPSASDLSARASASRDCVSLRACSIVASDCSARTDAATAVSERAVASSRSCATCDSFSSASSRD